MDKNIIHFTIRTATANDLISMVNVEQSAFPKNRWASEDTLKLRMELFPKGNLVAVSESTVLGFCNGFPIGNLATLKQLDPIDIELFSQNGKNWLLRNVAVMPKLQGIGIGKKLVLEQIEIAKKNNSECIRLTTTPNFNNFFSHLGFIKTRDEEVFHGTPRALREMQLSK